MSSSVPFERYDEEFLSLTEQVTSKLRPLDPQTSSSLPPTSHADLKMAHALLLQLDDLLKQMGLEARSCDDAATKRDLLGKVRVCKARLGNLREDYEAAKGFVDRMDLGLGKNGGGDEEMGGRLGGAGGRGGGTREKLLSQGEAINSQNETLANAQRIMAETEEVALEITSELSRHRETISSTHSRVRQVTGLTHRARRIVQSMSRREVQQKLILWGVGGCIVVVFLILVYGMMS